MDAVHDLERRTQKAKNNVEEIQTIVRSWGSPIFERKDGKKESLLNLEDCKDRLEKRYGLVRESGLRIHSLLKVRGGCDPQGFVVSLQSLCLSLLCLNCPDLFQLKINSQLLCKIYPVLINNSIDE